MATKFKAAQVPGAVDQPVGVTYAKNARGNALMILPGRVDLPTARARQGAPSVAAYGEVVSVEYHDKSKLVRRTD